MKNPIINYKPVSDRTPDDQYHELLRDIMTNGRTKQPIHARLEENKNSGHADSKEVSGRMLAFDLSNGFPLLPIRKLEKVFRGGLGEVIAFINGARTLDQLREYECPDIFWENWVSKEKCEIWGLPEGDLGQGSYGAVLGDLPNPRGGSFDQIIAVMKQMEKMPFLRTHCLSTWSPVLSMGDDEQNAPRNVVVAPCHGNFVHFILWDKHKVLEMTHTQRSADVPVGLQINVSEWAALGMMVAYMLGYEFTRYTHFLSNPHIYDLQYEVVGALLEREPRKLPTVTLEPDREIKSLKDFRPSDFKIADYDPHPWIKIDTPI